MVISVISALFAPPDAMSMLILAGPLLVMYEGAIWVVHWLGVKKTVNTTDVEPIDPLVGKSKP